MKPASELKVSFVLLEDLWRKVVGLPWICSWLGVSSSRKDQPWGYQLWRAALFGPHGDLVFSSQTHNRLSPPPQWGRKARQRNRFSYLIHPPGCREEEEKELSQFVFPYSQLFTSKRIYSVARYENSCRGKCSKWMELLVWVNQPLKIRSLSVSDLSERNWYLVQNWYISSFWGLILCDLTWCREIKVSSIQTLCKPQLIPEDTLFAFLLDTTFRGQTLNLHWSFVCKVWIDLWSWKEVLYWLTSPAVTQKTFPACVSPNLWKHK